MRISTAKRDVRRGWISATVHIARMATGWIQTVTMLVHVRNKLHQLLVVSNHNLI